MITTHRLAAPAVALAVIATGGLASTVPADDTYTSTTFAVPFEVALPDWLPAGAAPTAERLDFVTWESSDPERAIRVLAPETVIQPPDATEIEVPDDYVDYVLSLSDFGASVDDVVETTVDGLPATVATVTSPHSIDGAFGCEEPPAGECWGPIPDAVLRMAFIDTGDRILLVWQRDPGDASGVDYTSFDEMLASLDILEGATPAAEPADDDTTVPAASDPPPAEGERIPDGTYSRVATQADGEALGMDPAELGAMLGPDGQVPISIEIAGDRWTHHVTNDAGITEIGDGGTLSYDEDGRLVTVSESEGCPGCVATLEWTYDDGGALTLTVVDADDPNAEREISLGELFMTEGVYQAEQAADTVPDGTYGRVATRADGEALGLDDEVMEQIGVGADGEMPVEFEIVDDRWNYYVTNDAGIRELGTAGTYSYDDDGHLVLDEECCDATSTLEWTLVDGVLTLRLVASEQDGQPLDPAWFPGVQFVFEGDYLLQDDEAAGTAATVTLRFANPADSAPPQLVAFVEEVQRLSDGSIEFEWLPNYGVDSDAGAYSNAEATIVTDLADSTVDIGWVGARALPGFEALLAPLLVDSQDLQQQVFEAGIAERMLDELGEQGLVGITVMPGPLRRLAGVEHPFATPSDFAGATIANDDTELGRATMEALGATSVPGASGLPLDDLDAVLAHFAAITGNGYETQADSVVANVNFWPRPLTIVMSAESFEGLSTHQQEALLTAGANAVDPAMQASRDEDSLAGAQLCDAPIEVIEASDADLAALSAALEPVYAELESDPQTADYLDEIRALKEEVGAPPDSLDCSG